MPAGLHLGRTPERDWHRHHDLDASLTWLGSPNSTYTLGLMYHKDAFTFATAPLPLMAASEKCVRRTYDGLSIRVWQDSDIRNDEMLTRIDILYGFAAIRPEWATVIVGSAQ
jgi:hypothetical protein